MDRIASSRASVRTIVAVLGIVAVVACVGGCGRKQKKPVESIADIQKREGIPVNTLVVSKQAVSAVELVGGTAEGFTQAVLKAGVPGRIAAVNAKVGDRIAQNTSLMKIEPDIPQNYGIAKQMYENARKSKERVKALADEGGVSQEVLDQVETGYLSAKEALGAARKNEFVLAPFAGVVVALYQTVNSRVGPGAELIEVARLDKIRVPITVSDALINRFRPGQIARATVGADTITGVIDKVSLAGRASTHTFTMEALFDNPGTLIKPAMYLPIEVVVEEKTDVIALPMDAVIAEGAQRFVYAIRGGVASKLTVETGIRGKELYELVSGVAEGDTVVTSGASLLSDGAKVKIVDTEASPVAASVAQ